MQGQRCVLPVSGLKKIGVARHHVTGVGLRVGDVAAPALCSDLGGLQVQRGGGDGLERVAVAAAVGNRGGRASLG